MDQTTTSIAQISVVKGADEHIEQLLDRSTLFKNHLLSRGGSEPDSSTLPVRLPQAFRVLCMVTGYLSWLLSQKRGGKTPRGKTRKPGVRMYEEVKKIAPN